MPFPPSDSTIAENVWYAHFRKAINFGCPFISESYNKAPGVLKSNKWSCSISQLLAAQTNTSKTPCGGAQSTIYCVSLESDASTVPVTLEDLASYLLPDGGQLGRQKRATYAWSSRLIGGGRWHTRWAPVPSEALGAKKVFHHWPNPSRSRAEVCDTPRSG